MDIDFEDIIGRLLASLFCIFIAAMVGVVLYWTLQGIRYIASPIQTRTCTLISKDTWMQHHRGSGRSGSCYWQREYKTVWDFGSEGKGYTADEAVYTYAQQQSVLKYKKIGGEIWIVGIVR